MARRSTALRFRIRETETPAPEQVQRGLMLWGEYLLRHLAPPGRERDQTDHLPDLR